MAYTKYSLTPADNNAAPPNGAPEGMLPSGVNDTMRDMMSQIRDVGDGIRGGTYTMTAPVITGGSITGVALSGNTFTNPVITGGSINNTPIGATTANTGAFTTLGATGNTNLDGGTFVFNDSGADKDFRIEGDTDANLFFTDASADRIGVGTASPSFKLHVSESIGNTSAIFQANNAESYLKFTSTGGSSYIGTKTNSIEFLVNNAGNYAASFDTNGNLLVGLSSARANAGDVQVSKGISFPATQSAQSDANTLDDYEEGTFTPTVVGSTSAGTASYTEQIGQYTKIGNRVYINISVNYSGGTGTGNLRITGLPFTVNSTAGVYGVLSSYFGNITFSANNYGVGIAIYNTTRIDINQNVIGGGADAATSYDAAGYIYISGFYNV